MMNAVHWRVDLGHSASAYRLLRTCIHTHTQTLAQPVENVIVTFRVSGIVTPREAGTFSTTAYSEMPNGVLSGQIDLLDEIIIEEVCVCVCLRA